MTEISMNEINIIGLDLAKRVFSGAWRWQPRPSCRAEALNMLGSFGLVW